MRSVDGGAQPSTCPGSSAAVAPLACTLACCPAIRKPFRISLPLEKRFQRPCLSTGFTKGQFIKGLSSKYEPYNGSPTYQIFGKNFHKILIFPPKVRNGELPLGSLSNTTLQNLSTRGGRVLPDSVTCFSANKMSIKGCPQKLIAPGRPHLG